MCEKREKDVGEKKGEYVKMAKKMCVGGGGGGGRATFREEQHVYRKGTISWNSHN